MEEIGQKVSICGGRAPRRIYNSSVDWFLNCAARALGLKSSLGGQIFCLESGGPGHSSDSPDWKGNPEEVRRARELEAVWRPLTSRTQMLLRAQYTGAVLSERMNKSTGESEAFGRFPVGFAGEFDAPGVAAFLASENKELAKLVAACRDKQSKGSHAIREKYREQAQQAQQEAHQEWAESSRLQSPRARMVREMFGG